MNAEQWSRVKDVFHAALEREEPARSDSLDVACAGDHELRAEVERMLVAHADAANFIERPLVSVQAASMSGRRFGHYEIVRLIGVGGMGEVYAARDVELNRTVALKIASGSDAEAHARLRREAQHASQLNHPNVCTIHEVGTADGQPFIVMEYVEGDRLSDLIPPGGLPVATVVDCGRQIASALAHAHAHGVIHRDLKTANVVFSSDGLAKVLDFGLAQRFSTDRLKDFSESRTSIGEASSMAGTLSCMAPELLRGEPADTRSDIWSLGVLLYDMASGARPFTGRTGVELCAAVLEKTPAPLPQNVPVGLHNVITRCLAKDPRERYQQAADVGSALDAATALHDQKTRIGRPTVAAGLVLALLAGTGLLWQTFRSSDNPGIAGTSARSVIAVMPFERLAGATGEDAAWMANGVPSMLMTGLAETRGLDIVSAERLQTALRSQGGTSLAALDKSQAAVVAKHAGADAIVVGTIFGEGTEIRIDAQLSDLASGRIVSGYSVRGTNLFALVDQLAARIREGAGFNDGGHIRPVADLSTSSVEAYRLYSLAADAGTKNARMDEAQKLLEQAVTIDPTFAEAYQSLAAIMSFRGFAHARREYLIKAAEHADRLSNRQRLLLNVQLARDAGDSAQAERALDELLTTFPDTELAYLIAAQTYGPRPGRTGNLPKLLGILSGGVSRMPTSVSLHNANAYALAEAGRYDEGIRELELNITMTPREPNPYDSLGEVYLLAGRPGNALDAYTHAITIDPTFNPSRNGHALSLAMLGRYDEATLEDPPLHALKALVLSNAGRYRDADAVIEAAIERTAQNDDGAEHSWLLQMSSLLASKRKEYPRAIRQIQLAEGIAARLPEEQKRTHLRLAGLLSGVAQIGAGKTAEARATLDAQQKLGQPVGEVEKWWFNALEGEVALASGDLERAGAAFSAGEPSRRMWFSLQQRTVAVLANNLLCRDGLARVATARGDLRGAIQIYRRLLAYESPQKWVSAFEPLYVLEIARLLERSGELQESRVAYARFLALWNHADPNLPELAEARRAIARRS